MRYLNSSQLIHAFLLLPFTALILLIVGIPSATSAAGCATQYKVYADLAQSAALEALTYQQEGNDLLAKTNADVEKHFSDLADNYQVCGIDNSGDSVHRILFADIIANKIGKSASLDEDIFDLRAIHEARDGISSAEGKVIYQVVRTLLRGSLDALSGGQFVSPDLPDAAFEKAVAAMKKHYYLTAKMAHLESAKASATFAPTVVPSMACPVDGPGRALRVTPATVPRDTPDGAATIEVTLDSQGNASDFRITVPSGIDAIDQSALASAKTGTYQPACSAGRHRRRARGAQSVAGRRVQAADESVSGCAYRLASTREIIEARSLP